MATKQEFSSLIIFGRSPNKKLEKIRNSVPLPPPVDKDVEELVHATSCLHVGFLFTANGLPALQQICRFVMSAGEQHNGWPDLAAHLGLDPVTVRCIRNVSKNDLCQLTLEVFAQKEDASLAKVVSSLQQMNRVDAIYQSKTFLLKLVSAVLKEYNATGLEKAKSGLIMPPFLPDVPIIFKNLAAIQSMMMLPSQPRKENVEQQQDCSEDRETTSTPVQAQNKLVEYAYIVMLTFASDGAAAAKKIANVFRQTYAPDGSRVGVVILQEHSSKVNSYGNQYVLGFFKDVDYVVPIVTKGYVDTVYKLSGRETIMDQFCLDQKYARYIYQQMQAEYLQEGCINDRVRPIIVDDYVQQVQHEFFMVDALFQAWTAESRVAELAKRLM